MSHRAFPTNIGLCNRSLWPQRGELDLSLAMIDSTVVRAHQHAAGVREKTAEKYKQRNKTERLFGKLKGYRGIATHYDKIAAMFLGGVLASLLAVSLKCIVNTL